jgi:hypothetical protein
MVLSKLTRELVSAALALGSVLLSDQPVMSAPCNASSVRGNLQGENDRVRLSLGETSRRCATAVKTREAALQA